LPLPLVAIKNAPDDQKLYQTGQDPGSCGTQPRLPGGAGGQLKRFMMATRLRTRVDTAGLKA